MSCLVEGVVRVVLLEESDSSGITKSFLRRLLESDC